MADVSPEKLLTMKQAQMHFPGGPCMSTVRRWATHGAVDRCNPRKKGDRIILESYREGGLIFTTKEWITDFKDKCQGKR